MKLYTRRGDEGETGLFLGGRVSKADLRIEACGAADTAVSAMGLARALCADPRVNEILLAVQRQMFTVGAELATGPANIDKLEELVSRITPETVTALEKTIDELRAVIDLPRAFIVPGASAGSGALDLARSLLRTAERRVVALTEDGKLANPELLRFLNRLSDLLFVLARYEDRAMPFELVTGEG
jgi:cob(I)alamin adenosyltransferase